MPTPPGFPFTARVIHTDQPGDDFPTTLQNRKTGAANTLSEAQVELAFCTLLVLRGPGQAIVFVKHFNWNVTWQGAFQPGSAPGALTPRPTQRGSAGNQVNVGAIFDGPPRDGRFLSVLKSPVGQGCNAIARHARNNANVSEAANRDPFDVRR